MEAPNLYNIGMYFWWGSNKVLFLVLLKCLSAIAVCDEKVLSERTICESEGSHTLTCPKDHMVVIHEAKYYRSLQPGCGMTGNDSCFVDITNNLFRKCYKAQPCSFKVVGSQSFGSCARNHSGEVYLKIVYQCEPRKY